MHALRSKLNGRDFVQLNRSLIARRGFIERLSHQGRTWMAHLRDGSVERISRSHTAEVLEEIRSPSDLRESSNLIHFGEPPGPRLAKI
jgi:DNA-binding LytR/AlgR family response regulator